jgi:hypothetical protein
MGTNKTEMRSEPIYMVISALLFAYFGFGGSWAHQNTVPTATQPSQMLGMVVLLKWTLRAGALTFGTAALLSMLGSNLGPLLYAVGGLVTAVLFGIVAIWEWTNPRGFYSGVPAILLIIFALWNGYGSWASLRQMLARRPTSDDRFLPPESVARG